MCATVGSEMTKIEKAIVRGAGLHPAQTKILRELLFMPAARFAELQKASGLESDHVKFHIKRLVELGYVDKIGSVYQLSVAGKEYANKLDTDAGVIERQPKVAVLLVVERYNSKTHMTEYLLQKRLKHPYFGFWGAPTGKVRWGETLRDAAVRELKEETGLTGVFEYRGIYHERVRRQATGEIIEDKLFQLMFCDRFSGELQVEFDGGRNTWRTLEDMALESKKYKGFEAEIAACLGSVPLTERMYDYGDEF